MKTLIIYYSQHGSTEVVARTLAKELKTDILEVTDLKNRSGFKNKLPVLTQLKKQKLK